MLPVYKAISFNKIIEKGGRTKPWLVIVNAGNTPRPYVVKLFETSLIDFKDSVTSEVLGNVLAKEFNLPVPNAALIDFDDDFIDTIKNQGVLEILEARDTRLKFGSELLDGYVQFDSEAFKTADIKQVIDIDNVFAFDNLIRNPDRKNLKPNILIKSNEAYLIDHELGFEINNETINELKTWQWNSKFYNQHIFYNFLRDSITRHKTEYFDEFGEYLRLLNLNILTPYFHQLIQARYSPVNHGIITNYLTQMKQNSANFVYLMRAKIQ